MEKLKEALSMAYIYVNKRKQAGKEKILEKYVVYISKNKTRKRKEGGAIGEFI